MRSSPMVVIERSLDERIEQLLKEYVTDMLTEFTRLHTDQGHNADEDHAFKEFADYLLNSLQRICKR